MNRRTFLTAALFLGTLPRRIAAQGMAKPTRIGWLTAQQAASLVPYVDAFRASLAELGYI